MHILYTKQNPWLSLQLSPSLTNPITVIQFCSGYCELISIITGSEELLAHKITDAISLVFTLPNSLDLLCFHHLFSWVTLFSTNFPFLSSAISHYSISLNISSFSPSTCTFHTVSPSLSITITFSYQLLP